MTAIQASLFCRLGLFKLAVATDTTAKAVFLDFYNLRWHGFLELQILLKKEAEIKPLNPWSKADHAFHKTTTKAL